MSDHKDEPDSTQSDGKLAELPATDNSTPPTHRLGLPLNMNCSRCGGAEVHGNCSRMFANEHQGSFGSKALSYKKEFLMGSTHPHDCICGHDRFKC